jgi:hypothetical protein
VAEASIQSSENAGNIGHQGDEFAVGLQGAAQGLQHARGVFQMLEHVETEHGIEAVFQAVEIAGDFGIEALDGDVGRSQEPVAERVKMQRVLLGGHIEHAASHQATREVADAGADFEHLVAHVTA